MKLRAAETGASPGGNGHADRRRELTEEALCAWARLLGRRAVAAGVFVCLYGELGAGKSTLVRAACRGAGVTGPVPSPTFTLVNRHESAEGAAVLHVDLYRLRAPAELADIGWFDLLACESAVFVEWADRAGGHLPADRWDIRLSLAEASDARVVEAWSLGDAPALPPFARDEGPC